MVGLRRKRVHSDSDGMVSIPASPDALNVLLCSAKMKLARLIDLFILLSSHICCPVVYMFSDSLIDFLKMGFKFFNLMKLLSDPNLWRNRKK
jgi:hypothetical protein